MSGNAKFILLALVFFLNSCATAEYRMVKGECARDTYQQIPYKEEINIQTLFKTVQVPTGRMNCSGTTRKMGYFGGDPVCSMEMRSERQSYQNVRKIDANKGRRNQLINSCTESQCFARYGNARCEPKKAVQNIPSSKKYSTPNEDHITSFPRIRKNCVGLLRDCLEPSSRPLEPNWQYQ
jgi:hypothetical protein